MILKGCEAFISSRLENILDLEYLADKMAGNFQNIGLVKPILLQAKVICCKWEAVNICVSSLNINSLRGTGLLLV